MRKLVVITTAYNVGDWIGRTIESIKSQSYDNFEVWIGNDCSTDHTVNVFHETVAGDTRFHLVNTKKPRTGQGGTFFTAFDAANPDNSNVIVEVDGDDWLPDDEVFKKVAIAYTNPKVWMTYGQYIVHPTKEHGGHWNYHIEDKVDRQNTHRYERFPYSHLKSYYTWLLRKVKREDLIDPQTGEIWNSAWDHALCIPMVEMAGKSRIHRFNEVLYVLNRSQELQNEGKMRTGEQKDVEKRIRALPRYERLCDTSPVI